MCERMARVTMIMFRTHKRFKYWQTILRFSKIMSFTTVHRVENIVEVGRTGQQTVSIFHFDIRKKHVLTFLLVISIVFANSTCVLLFLCTSRRLHRTPLRRSGLVPSRCEHCPLQATMYSCSEPANAFTVLRVGIKLLQLPSQPCSSPS